MGMKRSDSIKRNLKDSVFVNFFGDGKNVMDLYRELHPEDTESTVDDIDIRTVKRVIMKGYTNDLGFSVGNRYICLVEAQSYDLRSIQLRMMFYISETYQEYLKDLDVTLYDMEEKDVPQWEAYIIRTGKSQKGIFKLDSLSGNLMNESLLERIPEEDGLLQEYIDMCDAVDSFMTSEDDGDHKAAAVRILEACRDRCGRIGSYVWSRRFEVMGAYEQMFDDEENLKMLEKAWKKENMEKGRKEGIKEGSEKTKNDIARKMLSKNMSPEDISEITGLPLEDVIRMSSENENTASD